MSAKRRKPTKRQRQLLQGLIVLVIALALSYFFPDLYGPGNTGAPGAQSTSGTAGPADGQLYFIDVGQGDASLIASGGEYVLIDGGPGSAEGELVAYLESLGIERFRAVIATHPHEDHIGGLDKVLARFPADAFYMPDKDATTACFERMLDEVEAQGLEITIPEPGEMLRFGDAVLEFLSPAPENRYDNTNDYSIVTKLTMGGMKVLYMGDAETPVERELLDANYDLDCDIIKLGHHGSSTSSSKEFLEAASPETAVISCAKDNDYGHPHRETLQSLREMDIPALYTYEGTVVLPGDSA